MQGVSPSAFWNTLGDHAKRRPDVIAAAAVATAVLIWLAVDAAWARKTVNVLCLFTMFMGPMVTAKEVQRPARMHCYLLMAVAFFFGGFVFAHG